MSEEKAKAVTRCHVCHRPLTDPASVRRGAGPTCFGKAAQPSLFDPGLDLRPGSVSRVGIHWSRDADGHLVTNVPRHALAGGATSYDSKPGLADMALNALALMVPPSSDGQPPVKCPNGATVSATAWWLRDAFAEEFLSGLRRGCGDGGAGVVSPDAIRDWLALQVATC